jgi:hypothetical protein
MVNKVSDMTVDEFSESIAKAIGSRAPTGGTGGGGGGGGTVDMPNVKKVDGFVGTLLDSLFKINRGASTTGEGLSALGAVLGKMPGIGQTLQAAYGGATGTVLDYTNTMKQATLTGASFGQNIGDFAATLGKSGMTTQEFLRNQERAGGSYAGLGPDMGIASKNVVEFNEAFKNSKTGQQLSAMNMNAEDIAKITNSYLANVKNLDLTDRKSREEAVKGAERHTQELMKMSNQTGIAVDKLAQKNALESDNMDVLTTVIQGGEEAQRAYSNMLPSLVSMGPTIKSFAEEAFSTDGLRTEQGAAQYSALGADAAGKLMEAVEAQKIAAKDGATQADKDRAAAKMERAQIAIDQRMRDDNFLMIARNPDIDGGVAKKMLQERNAQVGSQMSAQAQLKKQGQPADIESARRFQDRNAQAAMAGVDPATGKRSQGADFIAGMSQVDIAGRALANKVAIEGVNTLGDAADKAGRSVLGFDGRIKTPGQIVENPKVVMGGSGRTPPRDPGAPPKQEGGSKETFGDWFAKDWGKGGLSELHGVEAVVPKDKLPEFMRDMMSSKVDAKQMEGLLPKMPEVKMPFDEKQLAGMMPKMDNIKMPFDDKQISSMMPKLDNLKMPFDEKQMGSAFSNIKMPSSPMSKDFLGDIKSQVSSMGTEISSAKTPTTPQALPDVATNETATTTSESNTTVFNTDVLTALNSLNKMMGELVSHSQTGNEIADSMTRKIGSSNRFEG